MDPGHSTHSPEPVNVFPHRVAAILEAHSSNLIEEWTVLLRQSLPDDLAGRLSDQEVVAGVERLLDAILVRIRSDEAADALYSTGNTLHLARVLGNLRREQGYSLRDVVHENVLFQERLWTLLKRNMRRTDAEFLEVIRRINDGFSRLLLEVVNTYHEQHTADLRHRAVTDMLLTVYNRSHFDTRLHEELKRAERFGLPFSLLMIDIDKLKSINDQHGHRMGDEVLRHVAAALRGAVREPDIVARYSGDEFAIILPNTERRGAWTLALRLTEKVRDHLQGVPELPVTSISVGIATYPEDGRTEVELIDAADSALYRSKAIGRGAISCFPPFLRTTHGTTQA